MNNLSANTNSGGCVQSNSVTSQFNALSVDRENFRNAKQVAKSAYDQIQEALRRLKQEQTDLLNLIRTEQEVLGNLTRKSDMLQTEKARHTRVMDCERKALEACVKHARSLTEAAERATLQYANDMGEASAEVAGYLQREVHSGIIALISVDSVQNVVVPKLPNDPRIHQAFYQSFQVLSQEKKALDEQVTRHSKLSKKSEASQTQTNDDPSRQMDFFYGLSHEMNPQASSD